MSEANYSYACTCGVEGELSPGAALPSTCPRCGKLVMIFVISEEELPAGDPRAIPELVFSESQLARKWPRGFWHRVAGRMARGEVIVASKTAGRILQQETPPEPLPTGRRPGPLLITDEEEFRQTVRQAVCQLKSTPTRVNVTNVAKKCGWARGTLYRYAKDFQINIKAFINELVRFYEGGG